MLYTVYTHTI